MAIDLSSLILRVRRSLADVPEDYMTDVQIYDELKSAQIFVNSIVTTTATETDQREAIIHLSSYFSYINYTSMAERRLGEVPPVTYVKLNVLRQKALTYLQTITDLPLTADLIVDTSKLSKEKPFVYGITKSLLEDV